MQKLPKVILNIDTGTGLGILQRIVWSIEAKLTPI